MRRLRSDTSSRGRPGSRAALFVRDVADELAGELAEASAVTAAQGTPDRPAVDAT
jgi:hypothetical protein